MKVPNNLKTISVERNREGEVVELFVCNGKHHHTFSTPFRIFDRETTVCTSVECSDADLEFPTDVVPNLCRKFQIWLGFESIVGSDQVLVAQEDSYPYTISVTDASKNAPLRDFVAGFVLSSGEYIVLVESTHDSVFIYNLNGKSYRDTKTPYTKFEKWRVARKWRKKAAKLGLSLHNKNDHNQNVFSSELSWLNNRRAKLLGYPQTENVRVALREIDEAIALIVRMPQTELVARAEDIALSELDDIRRMRNEIEDRVNAHELAIEDVEKIQSPYQS